MIGDANLLDGRQIDDAQVVMLGVDCAGFDVILDVLGQAAEQKFIGGCAGRGPHFHRLPLGSALVLGEQADLGGIEAHELRCHQLIGLAAHGAVAGLTAMS